MQQRWALGVQQWFCNIQLGRTTYWEEEEQIPESLQNYFGAVINSIVLFRRCLILYLLVWWAGIREQSEQYSLNIATYSAVKTWVSQSFFPLLSVTVHVFDYVKNINIVEDINGDAEDVKDSWMANYLFSLARLSFNNARCILLFVDRWDCIEG